jgi:hypothetical protein
MRVRYSALIKAEDWANRRTPAWMQRLEPGHMEVLVRWMPEHAPGPVGAPLRFEAMTLRVYRSVFVGPVKQPPTTRLLSAVLDYGCVVIRKLSLRSPLAGTVTRHTCQPFRSNTRALYFPKRISSSLRNSAS